MKKNRYFGRFALTLLAAGFGMAFPALKWFLRWRKRCRTRLPSPEEIPPGSVPAAAR